MQYIEGKKGTELSIIQTNALAPLPFSIEQIIIVNTNNKTREDYACNIFVSSVFLDILTVRFLLSFEEIKRVEQEKFNAKEIKLGDIEVNGATGKKELK